MFIISKSMTKTAKAIAPAKLIFFGEHSVVYPSNKVVIASLGLYLKSRGPPSQAIIAMILG